MNGVPSGPMLLLKSLGFDPAAILENIESAKTTANDIMGHFDKRLQAIESTQAKILDLLTRDRPVQ